MFMSTMTSKYHNNVFKASHQHQIILTLVNLAKDLKILQKKASSMSSIFKFFTSFDCTPAHDTAHLHLSSCLHMSGNPKFSENAISHKQKNKESQPLSTKYSTIRILLRQAHWTCTWGPHTIARLFWTLKVQNYGQVIECKLHLRKHHES
jgi:hypothetical protein